MLSFVYLLLKHVSRILELISFLFSDCEEISIYRISKCEPSNCKSTIWGGRIIYKSTSLYTYILIGKIMFRRLTIVVVCLLLCMIVNGDIYMHFPPGSINKNREQNDATTNQNRLFDSQNNNNGGYHYCGSAEVKEETDGYEFYVGTEIDIQWTVQHSCGPDSNVECNVVTGGEGSSVPEESISSFRT